MVNTQNELCFFINCYINNNKQVLMTKEIGGSMAMANQAMINSQSQSQLMRKRSNNKNIMTNE